MKLYRQKNVVAQIEISEFIREGLLRLTYFCFIAFLFMFVFVGVFLVLVVLEPIDITIFSFPVVFAGRDETTSGRWQVIIAADHHACIFALPFC